MSRVAERVAVRKIKRYLGGGGSWNVSPWTTSDWLWTGDGDDVDWDRVHTEGSEEGLVGKKKKTRAIDQYFHLSKRKTHLG